MRLAIFVVLSALLCVPSSPMAGKKPTKKKKKAVTVVELQTSMGNIRLKLFRKKAPITTANFLKYARAGFYNGTIFHRVIKNFMVQGGGLDKNMVRKQTTGTIRNEATNGVKNGRGTVAMARTGQPHSASAQFFINVKDNFFLDHKSKTQAGWGYCVFAKVIGGMKVVTKIENTPTTRRQGRGNVPVTPVVLKKVVIIK